jgi:two-component system, response regulator PdtaR
MSSNVSTRTRGNENLSDYLSPMALPERGLRSPVLNILIADNNQDRGALIKNDLIRSGHQVAALARSGQEACHLCQAMRPDLALLDLDLPQMDGLQTAFVIKRNQRLPVVLMVSRIKPRLLDEALKAGVQACLIMPMEPVLLERYLRIAHDQFQRLRGLEEQAESLRLEIKTRKLMGRASGILMQRLHIGYDQAVKRLHEKARTHRLPLLEIALGVISAETTPIERPIAKDEAEPSHRTPAGLL